ncbi:Carboxyesterase 18, putative [Theobroma cacao]|uniref:Carboxyesterase 18, putative n=1 Tax=Theobroma cacao TaxID=3641 RepID=A0A061FJ79_THECC|nr:Carboxyesterase 18, putative [Theobroma cacao]
MLILPLKTRLMLAALSFLADVFCSSDATSVNRFLTKFLDLKASPSTSTKPDNGIVSSDIMVDRTRKLWFRLFTNTAIADVADGGGLPIPIIVYFHGGGFTFMAANSMLYDGLCKRLAREVPAIVVSVSYRLLPEHRYRSQYEDGFDVLKFIDNPKFEGFLASSANTKKQFFIAGGSACHDSALS